MSIVGRVLSAVVLLVIAASPVCAQKYPERPILVIEPFVVGTTADIGGRLIAKGMSKRLGQNLIVQNMTGALGQIAIDQLLSRKADGYTLCYCNDGSVITVPASYIAAGQKPPYVGHENLTAIGQAIENHFLMAAVPTLPVDNFSDLVAYIRAHPGWVTVASASPTSTIITGLLRSFLGPDAFVEVRYSGEPRAMQDVVSGFAHVIVAAGNAILPQQEAGTVKIIGAIGKRNPFAPHVPSLSESASPETEGLIRLTEQLMPWNGYFAPKGVPENVVSILSSALKDTLADPEIVQGLANIRFTTRYSSPQEFQSLITDRLGTVTKIIENGQIRLR